MSKRGVIIGVVVLNLFVWALIAEISYGIGQRSGIRKSLYFLLDEFKKEMSPDCYGQVEFILDKEE